MADFCFDCVQRVFPEVKSQDNDLADSALSTEETRWDICEGCGPGFFNSLGQKIEQEDDNPA